LLLLGYIRPKDDKAGRKMKILLVNNNTIHLQELNNALAGHEVEVQEYQPGIWFHDVGKDLVILSGGGGEGKEVHDYHKPSHLWYEDEMHFVRKTEKPVLGICMGFEIIASAFGAKVVKMPKGIERFASSKTTIKGKRRLKAIKLRQFEAHDWCVKNVPRKDFHVLAKSTRGIELIKHKKRPIIATQFHPEVPGGTLHIEQLLHYL
jgi:GMP synthase-like glutamine amidotransferase